MSRQEAETQWHKLTIEDQRKAFAALAPYLADCAATGRKRRTPSNFLGAKVFQGFEGRPAGADPIAHSEAGAGAIAQREFVEEGSEDWRAWQRHLQSNGKVDSPVTDYYTGGRNLRGWWFPTRLPPRIWFVVDSPEISAFIEFVRGKLGDGEAELIEQAIPKKGGAFVSAEWLEHYRSGCA